MLAAGKGCTFAYTYTEACQEIRLQEVNRKAHKLGTDTKKDCLSELQSSSQLFGAVAEQLRTYFAHIGLPPGHECPPLATPMLYAAVTAGVEAGHKLILRDSRDINLMSCIVPHMLYVPTER